MKAIIVRGTLISVIEINGVTRYTINTNGIIRIATKMYSASTTYQVFTNFCDKFVDIQYDMLEADSIPILYFTKSTQFFNIVEFIGYHEKGRIISDELFEKMSLIQEIRKKINEIENTERTT